MTKTALVGGMLAVAAATAAVAQNYKMTTLLFHDPAVS
jgi:hypothetical protein